MKAMNCEETRSTSVIETIMHRNQGKAISLFETLQRQKSATGGRSKSQSASEPKETSKPCHMKSGLHAKQKTAGDGDTNDPDASSGEESGHGNNRRLDRSRRPQTE